MKLVSEFKENDQLTEQLLVNNVTKGVSGPRAYLSLELRDSSGSIGGKKWDASEEDDNIFVIGNVVEVTFTVILYNGNLQLKVLSGKVIDRNNIDLDKFVQHPPISTEELTKQYNELVKSIKNETCTKLLNYFTNKFIDKLFIHPAAASIHHEYKSGLVMHSVTMAKIADYLCTIYKDVDRELLVTGALLHDMGKIIELEGEVVYKYSLEGKLLGHISIMTSEIRSAAKELKLDDEIVILLEHMVLSHHGQLEFGSPVMPLTKEALLLSMIDNLDSKMVIVSKALDTVKPGEMTQKVYPLDGRLFYKPKKIGE
ncbi:MAG: HD domain-containing protein [Bacilli bacterium]|nr:HD domain-containing protein [Bacilli bacterium]